MASNATMQRVMITIPPRLLQQVEEMMTKTNSSRSQLIREALEQYLETQPPTGIARATQRRQPVPRRRKPATCTGILHRRARGLGSKRSVGGVGNGARIPPWTDLLRQPRSRLWTRTGGLPTGLDHPEQCRQQLLLDGHRCGAHDIAVATAISHRAPHSGRNVELPKESAIQLHQLRTLDKRRLERYSGQLDATTMRQVDDAIKISLGLMRSDRYKLRTACRHSECFRSVLSLN